MLLSYGSATVLEFAGRLDFGGDQVVMILGVELDGSTLDGLS